MPACPAAAHLAAARLAAVNHVLHRQIRRGPGAATLQGEGWNGKGQRAPVEGGAQLAHVGPAPLRRHAESAGHTCASHSAKAPNSTCEQACTKRTLMFMRSASEEVAPWAQQEPQYWGMCCSWGTSGWERAGSRSVQGKPQKLLVQPALPATLAQSCHAACPSTIHQPHLVARGGQEVGAVDAAPVPVLGQLLGVEVGVRQRRLDQRLVVGWPANFGGKHTGLRIAPPLRARLCRLLRGQVGGLGGAAGWVACGAERLLGYHRQPLLELAENAGGGGGGSGGGAASA